MNNTILNKREEKTNISAIYPLSPMQGGFLFQALYEQKSDAYFMQALLKLDGDLDVDALKKAWSMLLKRHESLRACFLWEDLEEPVQVIQQNVQLPWDRKDWSTQTPAQQEESLASFIDADRNRGFDLTQAPLIRLTLIQLNDQSHYLLWSYHHIISDGWSEAILINELRSLYENLVNENVIPMLPQRRPYGDYVAWLNKQDLEKAQKYWKQTLAGCQPTKVVKQENEATPGHTYAACFRNLSQEDSQKLLKYASDLGVTVNNVLQTLWGMVLGVYTGQKDVVFGSVISGRQIDLPGVEEMVGIFINTLPLRLKLKGSESLKEAIKATQQQMIGMQEYCYIPLWTINAQLKESGSGLFDTTYVYQNYPSQTESGQNSGLEIRLERGIEKAEYKLGINLSFDQFLKMRINYTQECFSRDFIEGLLSHFEQLIQNVICDPSQKVGAISLLQPQERKLLRLWNETQHDTPQGCSILELFEASVARTPDAIAVHHRDHSISYQALNDKANQLAHYLKDLGVDTEVPVAIFMDRSIELIIGILGILKAGGIYVPLDRNSPAERLEYILEDSEAPFIVSRTEELETLSLGHCIAVDLDDLQASLEVQPRSSVPTAISSENLAYLIYTSGSTGRPKGVGISHGNLLNYINWASSVYGQDKDKPVLFHGSVCFDMSITSLFIPLVAGQSIRVADRDFAELLEQKELTEEFSFIKLTPSHLRLIDQSSHYSLKDLTQSFVVGGEALTVEDCSGLEVALFNEYGPTEATVGCSLYKVELKNNDPTIPIGKPIWNSQMFILDQYLNQVPIGVLGEIYIGGVGLARGYWNKSDLTAERFIPNPFEAGSRLYRTGDMGRFLPDGNIEFHDRVDSQVKLRGYRIELGEIEATLQSSERLQQAVILRREDAPGQERLVAYVVPNDLQDDTVIESLQSLCQNRLPNYMCPSQWVVLDSFPLNANGKIDRKALPAPEGRSGFGEYQAPKGEMEESLAQVWSDLLGVQVSRSDDFFNLGGHSLLATQMVSRLREVLKREVPLKAIFEHSVLSDLANYLECSERIENVLPEVTKVSREEPQALSFAQQRLWFLEKLLPGTPLYHNPMSFKISGALDVQSLRRALDAMIARHEVLRTVLVEQDGVALQEVLPEATPFPFEDSSQDIASFIQKPFLFDQEPLCRGLLVQRSEREHLLVLVLHHMIIDDWSMDIFCKELNALYQSYTKNHPLTLPSLTVQYIDFSVWQRNWLQGEVLEGQLDYWKGQLRDAPNLALPTDYPRPKELSYKGGVVYRQVDKELVSKLEVFAQSRGMTLFMALLASVQSFLSRYCNQQDICIGTPIANRRSADLEGLMGFFVNTLVLRTRFEDNPSFNQVLNRVEECTLSAYEHQDVPFEQLVEYLQVPREINRNPLFQVLFNMQHDEASFQLGDLEITPEEHSEYLSRFDLLINAFISGDGIKLQFDYAKDLFTQDRIERIADYYLQFLKALLDNPNMRLSEYPLLGPEEKQQLELWSETPSECQRDQLIHQLFEESVAQNPDATAVICGDQQLSYQELNKRSNQLAHHLRRQAIGPESIVAISMDRSIDMLIGLLGILKSGSAYVPLDPSYPQERLDYMLRDTKASIIITQGHLSSIYDGFSGEVLILEDFLTSELIESPDGQNLPNLTGPQNLAYIIYTSGSTGRPKGVGVSHEGLSSYLSWAKKYYALHQGKAALFHGSFAFDMAVTSLYCPLISGQTIHIPQEDLIQLEAQELKESCEFIKLTPSHLRALIAKPDLKSRQLAQKFVVGGEQLSSAIVQGWSKKCPNSQIINEYGPTEATVACIAYSVDVSQMASEVVPVGSPIANAQIHILDAFFNPCPQGTVGEIYIGGVGLARGYLNQPELTAEKFIPNPFKAGERLYKSGDLGRYNRNGEIEFLGRIDQQVKIRGYRIELEEIEAILSTCPQAEQVVVLCREDLPEQKHLTAYIMPSKPEDQELIPALQSLCQSHLPDYMHPTYWLTIPKLPLTSNGKVDKKALPAPEGREGLGEYEAPQGEMEEKLAKLWSDLLGLDRVSRDDNFFQVGGDSIVSIQLVSRARQQGMLFSVKQVFETPTLSGLAYHVKTEAGPAISQERVMGDVPLSPIQQWYLKEGPVNLHHFNQAMWIKSDSPIDLDKLQDALLKIYQHHDGFRLRYRQVADDLEQYYADENIDLPWQVYDGDSSKSLHDICTEFQSGLNIEHGPLSRLIWFKEQGQLLWLIHHFIVDGVSWRILLEDLNRVYAGQELEAKTHSYKDWLQSLSQYESQEALSYYSRELQDIPRIPIDAPYPGYIALKDMDCVEVKFTEELTKAFLQQAHQSYKTQPNDLLLLALVQAVGDCFGKYDVFVNLEGHGREDLGDGLDLTRTLGWFTSMHPVVLRLPDPSNMDHSIKHIKEHLRGIPDKGIAYGILSRIHHSCKLVGADILFNYLGQWSDSKRENETFFFGSDDTGESVSLDNPYTNLLEINGGVNQGQLSFHWKYSQRHYKPETMERFTGAFKKHLEALVAYCSDGSHTGYTPSDFPLCHLSQQAIDTHLAALKPKDVYPLSPIQEGFFFHALHAKTSDAYFVQTLLELKGKLQPSVLKQAWMKLLERYDNLRASFLWEDFERPIQIIPQQIELPWSEKDWQKYSIEEQEKQLSALIAADRETGFEFSHPPLMRWTLIKTAQEKYWLLWSYHHILSDGWSSPILLDELQNIYQSLEKNNTVGLLPKRRPYKDYIAWLTQQDTQRAERYWQEVLMDADATSIEERKTIDQEASDGFGECLHGLDAENTQKLLRYSNSLGVTPNTVLQTLWGFVLGIYAGQKDVVFGVVVSGRQIDLSGVEDMVGVFINTLPLRLQFEPHEDLKTAIQKTQECMIGIQEHAYLPLWRVQSQQKNPDTSLFDSTYVYQNFPNEFSSIQNSDVEFTFKRGLEKGEYNLGINLSFDDHLNIRINYSQNVFSKNFIERLIAHFEQIILYFIENPAQKIGEISCLLQEEAKQLELWNDTAHDYPNSKSLVMLFDESVERSPDQIAVIDQQKQISYKDLGEQANQLAHYLRDLGVGPEVPVALAMDRCSIDLVVGMLAVMKAGGIYVPLDTNHPAVRLEYMLEDCEAPFILGRGRELAELSSGHTIAIDVDEIRDDLGAYPKTLPNVALDLENLAYIIYTSGSTGRPKGVGVSHRSLAHLALVQIKAFFYQDKTKSLQFASIGFDASISELACSLANGSPLVLCNNKDIEGVEEAITKNKLNQLTLPPSVLKEMTPDVIAKNLEHLVVAGEALERSLLQKYRELSVRVINAYGPTEATVCATLGINDSEVHIGQPIWNTQVYILDQYLNQVPPGVIGELFIAGVGVARGYVNKPDLTAERFIPNPFMSGTRLYRTGDLARYRLDGNLEFLGRKDDQIKLRGFRIELGEIERILEVAKIAHQVVVVCKTEKTGQERLVAYVVPKDKNQGDLCNLLKHVCERQLPNYMHPAQWVVLDELPLTESGKVNRQALKQRQDEVNIRESRLPKSSTESALVHIFEELLGVTQIRVDDNFFEVGGNSLLAVRLVLEIKKVLGVKIRVNDIFENPTLEALAKLVVAFRSQEVSNSASTFIIQSDGEQKPIFFIHPGLGLSLPYLPLKEYIQDRPIIGIDDPYIGESISGFKSLEDMAGAYVESIRAIQPKGPYYIAGYSFGGMVGFEMARQLEMHKEELHALILIEAANPVLIQEMTFADAEAKKDFEEKVDRNVLLAQEYKPQPIQAAVSLIKAKAALAELTPASRQKFHDTQYGWDHCCPQIQEFTISGEHSTIFDPEHIEELGNIFKEVLA